ncbi:MAG: DNA polymerase I [Acidobacteria bacterium]|nr:DNA polymerase I [Acidobacteriota bacterium]
MAPRASNPRKRLYLIDAMSYIFRAYHVRPRSVGGFGSEEEVEPIAPTLMRFSSPQGVPTQAVFFFNNMLRKLLREHEPDYVAVVFESAGPTVRDALYKEYKAQRPPAPDDLKQQIPYIRRLCEALRIPMLQHEGYEADDVIATLARRAAKQDIETVIVTSDKDMLQLVRTNDPSTPLPSTPLRAGGAGLTPIRVYSPTKEKFFDEAAVEEYYGVPPEKVVEVVALLGDAIDNIPGAKGIGEKGARELIGRYGTVEAAMAHAAEVKQKRYREALEQQQEQIRMSKQLATLHADLPVALELDRLARQEPDAEQLVGLYSELGFTSLLKEQLPIAPPATTEVRYSELQSPAELETFLAEPRAAPLALWCEAAGEAPLDLKLVALAFSSRPGEACAASLGHNCEAWLRAARPVLEDARQSKTVHDAKATLEALANEGITLRGVEHDTALYSYLLQPTTAKHGLEDVAARRLNLPLSGAVAEKADFVARLEAPLRSEVEAQELVTVYERIERPLAPVLAAMERAGVRLDPRALEELAAYCEKEIERLTEQIYSLAGTEFNLNSPKQLGEILFEKRQLPMPRKRGKGKVASTAADVLEELAAVDELPARVLEYRELSKLKSTYIDVLPAKIHPRTGRLHTSFHQTGTATGRLSSSDPNLQNVPIRGELGNRIRAAFVAEPGWALVMADYSQIELRVLAHMSEDPVLLDAFQCGEDVHARTAQEVLGVPPLLQTGEHRRVAKMINFGIIYGLTAYGLGTRLGIEPAEAQRYIDAYFNRYAGVRDFRARLLAEVRRSGETRTLFGRRRPIPEINAQNAVQRNLAERTALNSPLQGTAADIIKLAMIRQEARLREEGLRARMILQVHDELLLEAPEEEVERAKELAKETMERVEFSEGEVFPLKVPLVVEVAAGPNWAEVK